MARPKHPNAKIESAVRDAEAAGWRFRKGRSHAFLRGYCPANNRNGHMLSVWSTPKKPEDHAKQIRQRVAQCKCSDDENGDPL